MTFSLVARDPQTGGFGMVVTSSSPAVAARCVHLRQGVGGAASQNITDPGLGTALLDLLEAGAPAAEAMAKLVAGTVDINYRQLSVVDAHGRTAAFSGSGTLGTHRTVEGAGAVAAGNLLSSPEVVDAIMAAYSSADGDFEDRLLAGLRAGRDAGGEEGPQHSAGLVVVDQAAWPVTDLRVDWDDDDPIARLSELWTLWEPQKIDYLTRAVHPDTAPTYGVPGDL
ncbi:DUF1028 domain-containing protein [Paenarthrobacter sp. PH39-S1]|uniref:DUF1028 domain-containing protein n=1 Tax=Paenarthrobacter sp. PH39-S1 TaxID=3046204 RepID=UPI0024B9357A|nr:DUF1028 domain-containing protein [Paenarthrobacter sp. PH39-S1]MDJ0357508.1 DUF1028 domain-containing protein [Paenarthrobacter sp. PH39-S1]